MQALSYRQRRPYNSLERAGETLPATSAFIERSAEYAQHSAKYDLRSWRRTDGEEKLLKGLTLTDEEARALKEALNSRGDL